MKNIFIYLLITIFLITCSSKNIPRIFKSFIRKTEILYYDNGCKKSSITFFNNKFDGPMILWDKNCELISETNYENGKIHGYWREYYPGGQLMHTAQYFYGQKNGYERWYYENGNLKSEILYEFGSEKIPMLTWDESGKILH